ncbi:hypothetical protein GDO86_011581 [Hymenochirus boettgeri]|uniref:Gastrin/cholecystokinin peptide hormone domain-containing protein n=1 Tax=Hymenochirus boettgeri TaxID=247094 RepID=A0A8T2JCA7_9PIPI|nr:hypothetical protein GDO86_011581 [Hymenochirus boettgeri]
MYRGICVCVLLAVLSASTIAHQTARSLGEDAVSTETDLLRLSQFPRYARLSSAGQKKSVQRIDVNRDQRSNNGNVLPKFIRKGSSMRYSGLPNRLASDSPHMITDRDYLGWMDFGRRSAEEYEYAS